MTTAAAVAKAVARDAEARARTALAGVMAAQAQLTDAEAAAAATAEARATAAPALVRAIDTALATAFPSNSSPTSAWPSRPSAPAAGPPAQPVQRTPDPARSGRPCRPRRPCCCAPTREASVDLATFIPDDPDPGAAWRRRHATEWSLAWAQCQRRSWTVQWPGADPADGPLIVLDRRPTPLRLARRLPGLASAPHPTSPARAAEEWCRPRPRPGPAAIRLLLRERRWWHRNAAVRPIPRGHIALTPPPPSPPPPWPTQRFDLADPWSYTHLIETAARTGFWVRRLRLRRLRPTIRTAPPPARLPQILHGLLYSRHERGDLTWAPRPPRPVHQPRPAAPRPTAPYHYHGSWLLRGAQGPRPLGYLPFPPDRH